MVDVPESTFSDEQIMKKLTEGLSPVERMNLINALDGVQSLLFRRTLREIRTWLIVMIGGLSAFGLISIVGIRETIIDKASEHLASGHELQEDVGSRVTDRISATELQIAQLNKVAQDAKALSEEIEKLKNDLPTLDAEIDELHDHVRDKAAFATASLQTPLDEIDAMLKQLRSEIQQMRENREEE